MTDLDARLRSATTDTRRRIDLMESRPASSIQRRAMHRWGLLGTAATLAVVVAAGAITLALRPDTSASVIPADFPPPELGRTWLWPDVWPQVPMQGSSPTEISIAFAEQVLGWHDVTAAELPAVKPEFTKGFAEVIVESPDGGEPVVVGVATSGSGGWVQGVSPSSAAIEFEGQRVYPSGLGLGQGSERPGIDITMATVPGADLAEVTVKLVDGSQLTLWANRTNDTQMQVYLPDRQPDDIATTLVRYVGAGRVLAAAGGSFNPTFIDPSLSFDPDLSLIVQYRSGGGTTEISGVAILNATAVDLSGWSIATVGHEDHGFTFPDGSTADAHLGIHVWQVEIGSAECQRSVARTFYACYPAHDPSSMPFTGKTIVLTDTNGAIRAEWAPSTTTVAPPG